MRKFLLFLIPLQLFHNENFWFFLLFSVSSGQQQQFHFAFGQRPFHFPADPLGFRMPPIGNCQSELNILKENTNSFNREKNAKEIFPSTKIIINEPKTASLSVGRNFHHYFERQLMRNAEKICFNGISHRSMIAENSLIKIFQFIDEENLTKISHSLEPSC